MKRTASLITGNFKKYDPYDVESYMQADGFKALHLALAMGAAEIIDEIEASGLKGRGGAAYPTGLKFRQSRAIESEIKHLICNADEGEPATFKDRYLIEYDPYGVIEGMIIAAYATMRQMDIST